MADNEQKPDEVVSGTEDTEAGTADGASSGATGDRGRPRLLVSGDRLGRYQLEEELGEGGMATVFRAIDVELRREVAIKVLFAHLAKRREIAQRFQREARAVAALDHPHILHVYDVGGGEDGEPPYLVLELVKGESLDEFASDRNIPAEVVAAIGVVLCDALECAHAAGIIHRDIKPANVLIADDGRLVLADFGVAHAEGDSLVTRTGAMLGTPAFMAPEQALGSDLTARSDLYSVGATLYRLATGSLPYTGSTAKIVSSILTGERESPQRVRPSVGPDFSAIVDKLMATDPDERYPDAKKVRVALGELVETVADDPEELVRRYFADPEQASEELEAAALRWSLAEGQRAAAAGRSPRALALANRALELDPDNHEALALVERASSEPRRWGMWVVLALLVAAGAAVGVYLLNEKPSTVAAAVADAAPARDALALASAVVDADVADAQADDSSASVDAGSKSSATGGTRRDRRDRNRPERRRSSPDAGARGVDRSPPDAALRVVEPPKPAATGKLTVVTDTWCDLRIDGILKGRHNPKAPRSYELDAGPHTLHCSQGPGMLSSRSQAKVVANRSRKLTLRLVQAVKVRVRLSKGAAVQIGSRRVGSGGTVSLKPGRYRVTVLNGAGQPIGSKYVTVAAGKPCQLRDVPTVGCFR